MPDHERVHTSISRSGPVTVVAVTTVGPVGVDVQEESATRFDGFASVALHHTERDGTPAHRATTWARKESLLKATGHGLTLPPAEVALSGAEEPPRLVHWPEEAGELEPVVIHDLELLPGYAAAMTVLSDSPIAVRVRQEDPAAPSPPTMPGRAPGATPR